MYIQDILTYYYDSRPFGIRLLNKISGRLTKLPNRYLNGLVKRYIQHNPGRKYYEQNISRHRSCNAIVSLTTFPERIDYVWLVIESLLRQTLSPSRIALYLSKEQFPSMDAIPESIKRYTDFVLDIRMVDGDIRSHKKYWYAVSDYPNRDIITADDDIVYVSDTIEMLNSAHQKYPKAIPCMYAHRIYWDDEGNCKPYSKWAGRTKAKVVSRSTFFGSGGGTYFPYGSLHGANQDPALIMKNCPTADDIWLNAITRINGYSPISLKYTRSVPCWSIKDNTCLADINTGLKMNDSQLISVQALCMQIFGVNPYLKPKN